MGQMLDSSTLEAIMSIYQACFYGILFFVQPSCYSSTRIQENIKREY